MSVHRYMLYNHQAITCSPKVSKSRIKTNRRPVYLQYPTRFQEPPALPRGTES